MQVHSSQARAVWPRYPGASVCFYCCRLGCSPYFEIGSTSALGIGVGEGSLQYQIFQVLCPSFILRAIQILNFQLQGIVQIWNLLNPFCSYLNVQNPYLSRFNLFYCQMTKKPTKAVLYLDQNILLIDYFCVLSLIYHSLIAYFPSLHPCIVIQIQIHLNLLHRNRLNHLLNSN